MTKRRITTPSLSPTLRNQRLKLNSGMAGSLRKKESHLRCGSSVVLRARTSLPPKICSIHFVLPVTADQANTSEAPDFNLFRNLALSHSQPTGNHRSFAFLAKRRGEMETLHAHVRQCTDVGSSRQANLTLYRDRRSVKDELVILIPLSDPLN
jgi:hypothetical protein